MSRISDSLRSAWITTSTRCLAERPIKRIAQFFVRMIRIRDGDRKRVRERGARLLERDPDNRVVKLFQARALDEIEGSTPYKKILSTMFKTHTDMDEYSRNIISKYTTEKEEFEKAKKKIKALVEKEGRIFIDPSGKTN